MFYDYRSEIELIDQLAHLDLAWARLNTEVQANIIKDNNYKSIIDFGCRYGVVNEFLSDYEYSYIGFDIHKELIDVANNRYSSNSNIEFKIGDWNRLSDLNINYPIDVLIFAKCLCYQSVEGNSDSIVDWFEKKSIKAFDVKAAIIEDLRNDQTDDSYTGLNCDVIYEGCQKILEKYSGEEIKLTNDAKYGNRSVFHIKFQSE